MKVVISVAHNAKDKGASWDGLAEFDESMRWSEIVASALNQSGISTGLIVGNGLTQKVKDVNILNAMLAVEIHFNANGGGPASGCETLYAPGSVKGKAYASILQRHVCAALKNKDRGIKEGWYKMDRPGIKDFPGDVDGDETIDYFLRATNCPALILEPEFIERGSSIKSSRITGPAAIVAGIREIINGPGV